MFFEKAKVGFNEWWRYFSGGIMIFLGWQTVAMAPVLALFGYITLKGGSLNADFVQSALDVGVSKNVTLTLILLSFVLACAILYLVVRHFHKKTFLSLITSREKFSWERAFFGFGLWSIMALVLLYVSYQQAPDEFIFSFDASKFIPLLLICVILLPFQTSFEELFFRGYGMQGVGLATGSRFLALLLPAMAFGLLHGFNPEVAKHGFWLMMPFYIGMGLFLGIMAIMDDGLEIPLGVHFANNLASALFVTMEESALKTDALFMIKSYDPVAEIPFSLGTMLVFLAITAFIYKWKDWGRLIRKV